MAAVGDDSELKISETQAPTKGESRLSPEKTGLTQDAHDVALYIAGFGTQKLTVYRLHTAHESRAPLHLQSKLEVLLRAIVIRSTVAPPSVEDLCDDLWPDAEGDVAKRNFDSTVLRLRRALGRVDSILVKRGIVSVNSGVASVDLHQVFAIVNQTSDQPDQITQAVKQLQTLIVGPLQLQVDNSPNLAPVIALISSKIRSRLVRLAAVAKSLDQLEQASQLYSLALSFGAGPETINALINTLEELGKPVEAEAVLGQYKEALRSRAYSK
jgi:two-component SAPR family response regulator